ncbi:MAG: putative nucleotidyltransferase component of viral defense system [Gammaproteobacteria bacterium]|jgi:predicted nucleotidyltransferase component of viral defense system
MLHYPTIFPKTLQLLKDLQQIEYLNEYFLVGGTSLALQIGHRISIDLDLFAHSDMEVAPVLDYIDHLGKIRVVNQTPKILNLFIDDIKVDFVSYRYNFIEPPINIDNLKLASIQDIAAMKLSAITGRGSRKDFIDLYFILQQFSLPQVFEFYNSKFPDGTDFLVFKSLTYFDDAEIEPMPRMLKQIDWEEIKNKIIEEVKVHFP